MPPKGGLAGTIFPSWPSWPFWNVGDIFMCRIDAWLALSLGPSTACSCSSPLIRGPLWASYSVADLQAISHNGSSNGSNNNRMSNVRKEGRKEGKSCGRQGRGMFFFVFDSLNHRNIVKRTHYRPHFSFRLVSAILLNIPFIRICTYAFTSV